MANELLPEASLKRLRLSHVRAYTERRGHEDEAIKASASLTPEQYNMAVRAHVDGGPVVIRGILNRGARVSVVSAVQGFEPLEQRQLAFRIP
jgi:hypothetical protein